MKTRGKIFRNKRNGTKFGYPTANIRFSDKSVNGLFTGYTRLLRTEDKKVEEAFSGKALPSIIFIGAPETLDEKEHRLESHILDFPLIDLYDSEIEVEMTDRLRDNQKFASIDELIEQMKKDEVVAREWFARQ
jgi:riboflavin kinase/FMN adenylyltransferase